MFNKKQEIKFTEKCDGIDVIQNASVAFTLECFRGFLKLIIKDFKELGLPIEPVKKTLITVIEDCFNIYK